MKRHNIQSLLFICFLLTLNLSCNMKINPPEAEKIPKKLIKHFDTRVDDYYWLNAVSYTHLTLPTKRIV